MKQVTRVIVNPEKVTDRVILWERDPAHPGGEAYIAGNMAGPIPVALTPAIKALIIKGTLIDQGQAAAAPAPKAAPVEGAAAPAPIEAAENVTEAEAVKRGRPRK